MPRHLAGYKSTWWLGWLRAYNQPEPTNSGHWPILVRILEETVYQAFFYVGGIINIYATLQNNDMREFIKLRFAMMCNAVAIYTYAPKYEFRMMVKWVQDFRLRNFFELDPDRDIEKVTANFKGMPKVSRDKNPGRQMGFDELMVFRGVRATKPLTPRAAPSSINSLPNLAGGAIMR